MNLILLGTIYIADNFMFFSHVIADFAIFHNTFRQSPPTTSPCSSCPRLTSGRQKEGLTCWWRFAYYLSLAIRVMIVSLINHQSSPFDYLIIVIIKSHQTTAAPEEEEGTGFGGIGRIMQVIVVILLMVMMLTVMMRMVVVMFIVRLFVKELDFEGLVGLCR